MLYSIKSYENEELEFDLKPTVVNTFYKFMVKKLNVFNEFLWDEFIHNPLLQE